MRAWGRRGAAAAVGILGLLASGCTSTPEPVLELGEVTTGEVVETVAAPATLEPRDRVVVSAPATGTVARLLVEDGDVVEAGDELLRLTAPSVDQSIAQARAAVEAADALAGVQGGVDLSPLLEAVGGQLAAVVPGLLDVLEQQVAALPEEADEARERATAALERARQQYADARARLAAAEREAEATAAQATASQRAAAEAQRRQAEVALEAARSRADDLLVTAPTDGVVELARGGSDAGAGPGAGALEGLAGSGDGAAGDLGALLGGGGATTSAAGPIAQGSEVAAGQALVTVFDLGAFRAAAEVDELDVVDVEEGQRATILVEAFPTVELRGVVEHVAIEPVPSGTGGVIYPVTVRLAAVPDEVTLRVGLSGSVEIETVTVDADTAVPSTALRRRGEDDVVYLARDGTIHEVPVTVDAIGQNEAAVTGELAVGDLVVVEGIDEVADGDPVPAGVATP